MRCNGGTRRDQKFICVATSRTRTNMFLGEHPLTVLATLIVEKDSRKIRSVNVRKECVTDQSGVKTEERTTFICSCTI